MRTPSRPSEFRASWPRMPGPLDFGPFLLLDESARAELARAAQRMSFQAGATVIAEGDPPQDAYAIVAGRVRVTQGMPPIVLATPSAPVLIGEISVVTGASRNATATAITQLRDRGRSRIARRAGDDGDLTDEHGRRGRREDDRRHPLCDADAAGDDRVSVLRWVALGDHRGAGLEAHALRRSRELGARAFVKQEEWAEIERSRHSWPRCTEFAGSARRSYFRGLRSELRQGVRMPPIAVLYENEAWMAPLFAALEEAGAPYERVFANDLVFDPAGPAPDWSLCLNKVSPSSYLRDHSASIAVARQLLPFLEESGVPVVNGTRAFALETSKARQLLLLRQLGIRAPLARVITDRRQAASAARDLVFPVIVKPNVGGSGALMRRFESPDELADAAAELDLGPDGTGLVQEFHESEDGTIRRVEFLGGEYLYAIRITSDKTDFNLCPADICQVGSEFDNCVVDAPAKKPLEIQAFDAP